MENNIRGITKTSTVIFVLVILSVLLGIASYLLVNKNSFTKDSFMATPIPNSQETLYSPSPSPTSEMDQEIENIQIESMDEEINQLENDATSL